VLGQRLGDITPEEAVKEGGYTIKEFQAIGVGYTAHGTLLRGSWCTSSVSTMDLNIRVWMVSADGASYRR